MGPDWLVAVFPLACLIAVLALLERALTHWSRLTAFGARQGPRLLRLLQRLRLLPPPAPVPRGRPIEAIARDAWRIGVRFYQPGDGLRFVKIEGIRRAYDEVLAEACDALGVEHLLRVLPPGRERDIERHRVEWVLHQSGLDLPDAA